MGEKDRYMFESFSSDTSSFDDRFSEFINKKYADGWKYKDCQYFSEGNSRDAFCIFKKTY